MASIDRRRRQTKDAVITVTQDSPRAAQGPRAFRRVAGTTALRELCRDTDRQLIQAGIDYVAHRDAAELLVALASDAPDVVLTPAEPTGVVLETLISTVHHWANIPVVVTIDAAADDNSEAARALDAEANALLPTPFTADELRRCLNGLGLPSSPHEPAVVVGDLHIDTAAHIVTYAGADVRLTHREFSMLHTIAARAPRLVSPQDLARQFSPDVDPEAGARAVRVMIGSIRAKLGAASERGLSPIETVRGVGYRVRVD
ncbi:MAG: winged helix-turn-helix transcriptional regulator [Microcella sp.]